MSSLHFLSYYFPPIPSVASRRNQYIYTELRKQFDNTYRYVTSNALHFPNNEDASAKETTYYIKTFDYRTLALKYSKQQRGQLHYDETRKQQSYIRFLIRLNETLPFSLLIGEGGGRFIWNAVRKILANMDHTSDNVLFTSFRPTADIIVGYIVKYFRPECRWIISMHDLPYTRQRPNVYFPRLQQMIWKRLLSKANHLITVSDGLTQAIQAYGVKATTLLNGVQIRAPRSAENEFFTISYTGSIYRQLMDPSILMDCLSQLVADHHLDPTKVRLNYAGKDSVYWMSHAHKYPNLKSIFIDYGLIPQCDAMSLQEKSNINYLMSWNDEQLHGVLTGKLFEYLGARNPILALINGKKTT
ncbi:MAG: hypothetical protein UZ09_BCD002002116 [Bacteroidetes bacterium OLB9]|nr:MAG: hypothetical protein UZ09_BCD002002116 [Bacteroidetes bacterium OLB9]